MLEGQDRQARNLESWTDLVVPGLGIGVGQIAHPHIEEAGQRDGLLPTRIFDAHFPAVDRRLFGQACGIDLGAEVSSRVEQFGEIEGNELAGPPQFVLVIAGLDERCGVMTVGQEPLRMLEFVRRRGADASTHPRLGRRCCTAALSAEELEHGFSFGGARGRSGSGM
ncbi:hypothetical protein [Rhodococcus rhodochrous]|uniref:Uncharacterized protein n=1 Tax=Rhodococcus rhodochrous TaxID=1829 RepID=A0AA47AEB2_RHORH|nr:hypothetical protein [Rhodococcus rhodochrous]UZF48200.1 hypothetical protein KUM34_027950 [Rhodococcus rhodochrous]